MQINTRFPVSAYAGLYQPQQISKAPAEFALAGQDAAPLSVARPQESLPIGASGNLLSPDMLGSLLSAVGAMNAPSPKVGTTQGAVDAMMKQAALKAADGALGTDENYRATLFKAADGNGDGTLTQSELQQSVIAGGGTAKDADALYAKIARNGANGVSQQDMSSQLAAFAGKDTFGNVLIDQFGDGASGDALKTKLLENFMKLGLNRDQAEMLNQKLLG